MKTFIRNLALNDRLKLRNPSNGSWWMVQIRPTKEDLQNLEHPSNGSWWMVQILSNRGDLRNLENPTNGSSWMVQIHPPNQSDPNAVKSDFSYMHF